MAAAETGKRVPFEGVGLALRLYEQPEARIAGRVLRENFRAAGDYLLDAGGLREGPHLRTVTSAADHDDREVEVVWDPETNSYAYFSATAGWVDVPADDLKQYVLDVSWLLRRIAHAMEIPASAKPRRLVDDVLWDIGDARVGKSKATILFGRRLNHDDNLDRACDALTNRIGRPPGVLLSTTDRLSRHVRLPGHHRFLPLRDCIVSGTAGFEIDNGIIKGVTSGAVRREGFSVGYRTAFIDGMEYKFSKKQAAIIEALDNAGGPIHKDELLAAADTDQTDLIQIFRSKGKTHPAWGVLILRDNQGNYFLLR